MSHTTFSTSGHTVAVTGPHSKQLADRIQKHESAYAALQQQVAQLTFQLSMANAAEQVKKEGLPPIRPHTANYSRRSQWLARVNPGWLAVAATALAWVVAWLLVSTVPAFWAGFFSR
jgi:type VI protein secretion system component VasF